MGTKKKFLLFFILTSIANGIPIIFNRYIMQQLGVDDYIKFQALWSVVLWFQPIVSLGSQNVIRIKEDHENVKSYMFNTLILSIPILIISVFFDVSLIAISCGYFVVYVSFWMCFLESSKMLNKSAIAKIFWAASCGIVSLLIIGVFNENSRLVATIVVGFICVILSKRDFPKENFPFKFEKSLYSSYGIGISLYVAAVNYIFFLDRDLVSNIYEDQVQYQFACGFYLMNLTLFAGKPLLLMAELGVTNKNYWNIQRTYKALSIGFITMIVFTLMKDYWVNLLFYSEDSHSLYNSTIIIWCILGLARFLSDLLIPSMHDRKYFFIIAAITLVIGYIITLWLNNELTFHYVCGYFIMINIYLVYDIHSKQRTTTVKKTTL